jgi:type I restriction enzyme S subunit
MKKYDAYKDSGIEWIGEIPRHWEVKRLKYLAYLKTGYTPSKDEKENYSEDGIVWAKPDDLKEYLPINESKEKISEIGLKEQNIIPQGSVLVCCIGSIGKFGIAGVDLVTNQQINSIVFNKLIDRNYGKYLIGSSVIEHGRNANGNVVKILNTENQKNISFSLPPLSEQTAIANYLDRKTAEIDELIADKKRLLELYEEEKTAIINQAVTKGLDPDMLMKDSGIEWLGEIPEHWEVKKIKHVVSKVGSGITPSGGANVYQLNGIRLLRSQNVHFDGLHLNDVAYITWEVHESMKNSKVDEGDVLLNITGASIGRVSFVEELLGEANVNQHVCILRPKIEIGSIFLYYVLRSSVGREQIRREQTGSGREGLNFEALKNFFIPFLNHKEQQRIVNHLETELSRIDLQISRTKNLIDLLTEYRTALISEVVTGKVKVV